MADLPRWGILRERPFTCEGNYLVYHLSVSIYIGIYIYYKIGCDLPLNYFLISQCGTEYQQ